DAVAVAHPGGGEGDRFVADRPEEIEREPGRDETLDGMVDLELACDQTTHTRPVEHLVRPRAGRVLGGQVDTVVLGEITAVLALVHSGILPAPAAARSSGCPKMGSCTYTNPMFRPPVPA